MGFKEDADFARYLTMGAYATAAVAQQLESHGHQVVELERYAMGNKVWAVKVKRLRLPDLLCIRCGRRFESKGKSKLEIKLSHSETIGREWFAGGMRPDDIFAFVRVRLTDTGAVIGQQIFVTRAALEGAAESLRGGSRKSFSAGSENDVKWPAWSPSYAGTFLGADEQPSLGSNSSPVLVLHARRDDGSKKTYKPKWPSTFVYVNPSDSFLEGDVVAGCVAPAAIRCEGDTWDWRNDLATGEADDQFAAARAARVLADDTDVSVLEKLVSLSDEDWRLRLEAAAALSRLRPDAAVSFIAQKAADVRRPPEEQIESVFVLTELEQPPAADALRQVAEDVDGRPSEVRAAAVWGLGMGPQHRADLLLAYLDDRDDRVALHAAAALPHELPPTVVDALVSWITSGNGRRAAIAAHVLARHGQIAELVQVATSDQTAGHLLAIRVLGDLRREVVEADRPLPPGLRAALMPIWAQHVDWLREPQNDGALDILDRQRVRF